MITSLIFTRQIFIQTILPRFIEIIVQRYLLCLIDYKVKALLGFQNLHAYGSYFGAKPCIDVHNTFSWHIISNKSRK